MASIADSIAYWIVDYYLAATVLMTLVAVVVWTIRQPARRMAVAWGGFVGLVVLALVSALPSWPRFCFLPPVNSAISLAASETAEGPGAGHSAADTNENARVAAKHDRATGPANKNRTAVAQAETQRPQSETHLKGETRATRSNRSVDDRTSLHLPAIKTVPQRADAGSITRTAASTRFLVRLWERLSVIDLQSLRRIALWGFLAGCGLTVFRVQHGVLSAARLCRQAPKAPQVVLAVLTKIVGDRERCPQLRVSPLHPVPIATGTVRPTILLPCQFAAADRITDCRSILAHEWAHIRNGDLWLLAIDRWLLPVLWIHPLYLWLRRAIRNDQELLADASAAAQSSPVDYAEMLLCWARRLAAETRGLHVSTALGVWERPSRLADRIAKLLHQGPRVELNCSRRWRIGSLVVLGSLPLLLSTASVRPATVAGTLGSTVFDPEAQTRKELAEVRVPSSVVGTLRVPPDGMKTSASVLTTEDDTIKAQAQREIEQRAIAEIRRLGGHVKTEPFGPDRLATEVNMAYGFTEEGARVDNAIFTDESLPQIGRLRNLRVLALTGNQVTDSGLRRIAALGNLERLCLWDAQSLTDDGVAILARLPRLRHLEISGAKIGDLAIERLNRTGALQKLSVQGGMLTDRSIASVGRMPNLTSLQLDFGDNSVGAEALSALRDLTSLEQLGLQSSALSDEALRALGSFKNLRLLFLGDCRVTEKGIEELRAALPSLHIITGKRTYLALASGRSAAECESTIRRSQAAVALIRKFVKRVCSENPASAADLICSSADANRQIGVVRDLKAIENIEWNVAYTDAEAALAGSTEFADRFGGEQVLTCVLKCVDGHWKIDEIGTTPAREGLEHKVRQFASAHPNSNAAHGWLPLPMMAH